MVKTVIDLLNDISDNVKMPKKITFGKEEMYWDEERHDYYSEYDGSIYLFKDYLNTTKEGLNEIIKLSEEAEIEELQLFGYDQFYYMNKEEQYRKLTEEYNKINELVRVVNRMRDDEN